jgi:hypothetical protein
MCSPYLNDIYVVRLEKRCPFLHYKQKLNATSQSAARHISASRPPMAQVSLSTAKKGAANKKGNGAAPINDADFASF